MPRASVLIALTAITCQFVISGAQAQQPNPIIQLAKKLNERVDFEGVDDARATLLDLLQKMETLYKVRFHVNEAAFKLEGLDDLLSQPVATKPIPKMTGVSVATVLERTLARLTTQSGATYLIRRDGIEITTGDFRHMEVYGLPMEQDPEPLPGYRPRFPLVYIELYKDPLTEALKELATATDCNIVLDTRAEERAKTPVTATLTNVPLDQAVLMLADMAGLKPVRIGKALYVTTPENALKLQREQDEKLRAIIMPQMPGAGFSGFSPSEGRR